jgi:hypothetical protein
VGARGLESLLERALGGEPRRQRVVRSAAALREHALRCRIALCLFALRELIPAVREAEGVAPRPAAVPAGSAASGLTLTELLRLLELPHGYHVEGDRVRSLRGMRRGAPGSVGIGSGSYMLAGRSRSLAALRDGLESTLAQHVARRHAAMHGLIVRRLGGDDLDGERPLYRGRDLAVFLEEGNVLTVRRTLRPWAIVAKGVTRHFRQTELRAPITLADCVPVCGPITTHPQLDHMFVTHGGTVCTGGFWSTATSAVEHALANLTCATAVLCCPSNPGGAGGYQRLENVSSSATAEQVDA